MSGLNSPAEILQKALVDEAHAVLPSSYTGDSNYPVFVGFLPNDPDNALCIYDTVGYQDGRLFPTGEYVDKPGWQLRVRATDYPTGYSKIKELRNLMSVFRRKVVVLADSSYIIHTVGQTDTILSLGQEVDAKRRNEFTMNGTLTFTEL